MTDYPIHPAANIYPMMKGAKLAELAASIAADGLKHPVLLYQGAVIDGRNRLAACAIAGAAPRFATVTDEDVGPSPTAYVIALNEARRHLSPTQRGMVAVNSAKEFAREARERQREAGSHGVAGGRGRKKTLVDECSTRVSRAPLARTLAARAHNVGEGTVRAAIKLAADAEDVFLLAFDGDINIQQSKKLSEIPREDRAELVRQIAAGTITDQAINQAIVRLRQDLSRRAAAAAANDYEPTDSAYIVHGDCLDMIASLADGSVSLLLTDPPYAVTDNDWDTFGSRDEYLAFMRSWLAAVRPKMADKFHAFVFCDATLTVDIHNVLVETGWPILRQAIWHKPNLAKKRSGSMTFMSSYEPFWHCGTHPLHFPEQWGDERFDVQKFVAPQSNHADGAVHPTQKPLDLFRRLVLLGSAPGELVVDPFCGSGTTALACQMESRRCVTSDQSEEYVTIAKGRLARGSRDAAA